MSETRRTLLGQDVENNGMAPQKAILNRIRAKDCFHPYIPLLGSEALIGRSEESDFIFPDPKISRKHASFQFSQLSKQWNGLNGVWVNNCQIPKDIPFPLNQGDRVQFGPEDSYLYEFCFVAENEEPEKKRARLHGVSDVLKQLPEFQNVSTIVSHGEAIKTIITNQNAKEAHLLQERHSLEENIKTQNAERDKLMKEIEDLKELLKTRSTELEQEFLLQKANLEDKLSKGVLEHAVLNQEKCKLAERYQRDTDELNKKLQEERTALELRLVEGENRVQNMLENMEKLLQSVAGLQNDKLLLEQKLQEERVHFEQMNHELQEKLKEKRQAEEKLGTERAELEQQRAEEKRNFERRQELGDAVHSMLRQEREDAEQRYREQNSALEAQLAEMQAKLEEQASAREYVQLGMEVFDALQQCMGNSVVVIESNNEAGPTVRINERGNMRELLEKAEAEKQSLERQLATATTSVLEKVETAVESELQCTICNELFVQATSLSCMHTFCEFCINSWRRVKNDCPTCRVPINNMARMHLIDNVIEAVVRTLTENLKQKRQEVVLQRQETMAAQEAAAQAAVPVPAARRGRAANRGRTRPRPVTVPISPQLGRHRSAPYPHPGIHAGAPAHLVHPHVPAGPARALISNGENSSAEPDVTITLSSGSEHSDSDTDDLYENLDADSDSSVEGLPYAYYGGYGNCFNCGGHGHWAPGCPFS